ncbi:hypothetical protein LRP88_01353 [Fusarium phalaenopsidis]
MRNPTGAWGRKKRRRRTDTTTTPPSNPTEAPDRNAPIQLSEADLIKKACEFREFSSPDFAPGVIVRDGLDNSEDLVAYGVPDNLQEELWKEEIARLAAAVTDLDTPIHFVGSDEFKLDSKEAHENLAGLADKVLVALYIVIHDSQGVLLKHFPDLVQEIHVFKESRLMLERFVANHSQDDDDDDDKGANTCDALLDALNINHADYFEFVNYVTATLSRMFCKAASGKMWHDTILAKFAKMAAKMKVVSDDLREHAVTSLQNTPPAKPAPKIGYGGAGGRTADHGQNGPGRNMLEDLEGMLGMMGLKGSQPSFVGPNTAHKALTRLYFMQEAMAQYPIFKIYQYVLVTLRGTNTLRTALSTSYEMSAMLYRTGYGDFPVFLFQDIDGEFLGSSSDENINVSHAAFQVANMAANGLESRHQALQNKKSKTVSKAKDTNLPPPPDIQTSVGTTIAWYYTERADPGSSDSELKQMRLNTMSDVITVMVPMTLASPTIVAMVTKFIGVLAFAEGNLNHGQTTILYRPTEFKASFCLTTDEYRKTWGDHPDRGIVSQLSASLVARDSLLSWHPGKQTIRRVRTIGMELPTPGASFEERERERERELREEQEHIQHSLKQFEHASKRMEEWIFEENGVRVRCDWYVGTVSAVAAVLVLSGIAAGITIGERLPGVDPFNITTFSWVLAAFLILIAKSFRVASWTWWDFLHRQVLCRSVSELSSVTGIDDQLILARLLQQESGTPLQTRGPFNTVFSRKASGGDGFSIDQPLSIRTMLLSGLIMIQVQAIYHGKFLVCLDLRRGTEFNVVLQTRESVVDEEECIVSDRLVDEHSLGTEHRIILKKAKASWSRVVGVYGQNDAWFF